jgi:C-terminal processing protease CtpA/Prc
MRLRPLYLAACGVLLFSSGCASQLPRTHHEVRPAEFDRRFSADALRADLRFLLMTCEAVHPDLYHKASCAEVAALLTEIESSLGEPLTRRKFFPHAARLAACFGDGHTAVQSPYEEWNQFCAAGGLVFPMEVTLAGDVLRVVRCHQPDCPLAPGDTLLTINGESVAAVLARFRQERAGPAIWVDVLLAQRMTARLWLHGVRAPFEVEYVATADGARRTVALDGLPAAAWRIAASSAGRGPNYRFEWLDGDIGYLDFRSMVDRPAFRALLTPMFTELRDRPARGLIVDLRRNGGGNSQLGDDLLSYISDRPYRMAGRKEWKVSRQLKSYLKAHVPVWIRWFPLEWLHEQGRRLWLTPEGQCAVFEGVLYRPPSNPLHFDGPVCLLIGRSTFSSALMLANAVADYDLATLIGEETAETPNSFGEVYSFDLPHTRLSVGVSTARFVRANGDAEDRGGVRPDIAVVATSEDERRGIDAALERARRWITDGE